MRADCYQQTKRGVRRRRVNDVERVSIAYDDREAVKVKVNIGSRLITISKGGDSG